MLEVILPISFSFNLILSPLIAVPDITRIPQVLHFFSDDISASFPIKFSLSKFINLPSPTEKGLVFFEKSCPADKSPASILLHLNPGVATKIIPNFFPCSRI